jgi:hypothetical protein
MYNFFWFVKIEYIQKVFDVNVLPCNISSVLNKSTQEFVFEYVE